MEIVCVQVFSRDEEATRFLKDPPRWFWFKNAVFFASVDVKTNASSKAYGADNRMIRASVFVGHDPNTGRILVN